MTEWDRYAATWDRDDVARAYARAAFGSLGSVLAYRGLSLDGTRVCDFGCGTGLLTELVAGNCVRIDAVDTSLAMLGVLETKIEDHGWSHVRATTDLPTSHAAHDLVICSSVCGLVDDYPGTVQELAALLRPWESSFNGTGNAMTPTPNHTVSPEAPSRRHSIRRVSGRSGRHSFRTRFR